MSALFPEGEYLFANKDPTETLAVLILRLITILSIACLVFLVLYMLFWSSITTIRAKRDRLRPDKGEELIPCNQCQSYLPKADAIFSHGHYFCREECARLFTTTA